MGGGGQMSEPPRDVNGYQGGHQTVGRSATIIMVGGRSGGSGGSGGHSGAVGSGPGRGSGEEGDDVGEGRSKQPALITRVNSVYERTAARDHEKDAWWGRPNLHWLPVNH